MSKYVIPSGPLASSTGNALVILAFAALIGLLEWCINRGPIRRAIERQFSEVSPTPQKLRQHVYQSNIRIIGLLHLAVQLPLALAVVLDPAMQRDRLYSTSRRSALMLCISAGYFLHDLYHCLTVFSEWGVPYLLHATLCCSLYSYGAITGCLHYFGAEFLLWEASTPCVYIRWVLYKLKKTDSTAYVVNGIAMLLTFFLTRNVFGLAMSVDFFRVSSKELRHPTYGGISPSLLWGYRIANVLLNGLNAFWVSKMASGAAKLLRKRRPSVTADEARKEQ
jgi:hypothetical protein